ncbi:methylamine utilization protein MauJ [Catenulispora pinisilvae]|uniref:methylamine utilization protein MauJ n=1 Tax=Catenulispora pinisilvae TaxID=2705253 RepID=UPI001891674C|nr:methylamine utilization protein MauJ [Catenulispora pinisilvae]
MTTAMNIPALIAVGDSLLESDGLNIDLHGANGAGRLTAAVLPNADGRLARIELTVLADGFADAEQMALDHMSMVLSRIAFQADVAVEVGAIVVVEKASQIVHAAATVVGAIQPAPMNAVEGWSTEELGPFLAAYREGLNNPNAPLYQALSFYKILEGAPAFHTRRVRAASRAGKPPPIDPFDAAIPADASLLSEDAWNRDAFAPYFGLSFTDVEAKVRTTIRNGAAHLKPGMENLRIADMTDDVRACRAIVPVLRYVARQIIEGELALANAAAGAPIPSPPN